MNAKEMRSDVGIASNRIPFLLLVVTNFFVGGMVGLERSVLPLLGERVFGLASTGAALSFIVSFGLTKGAVNLFAGALADRYGRKRILLFGWGIGFWVPVLIITAPSWTVILLANVLLGLHQGLTWSMTVNMKLDLVRPEERGTAVGLNEFAGYLGASVLAALSGYVAMAKALRPEPFYFGFGLVAVGFLLSLLAPDTAATARSAGGFGPGMSLAEAFRRTTWVDRRLMSLSFAGLTTNLKDGLAWGIFPLLLAQKGLDLGTASLIVSAYPAAWGLFQLLTGPLSDRIGRKTLIVGGMAVQAASLWAFLGATSVAALGLAAVLLGIGTAMVYPTLQAAVGDRVAPAWRASALGVYRFWRDEGYAFGALLGGALADVFGLRMSVGLIAFLPLLAAGLVARFDREERG
ncbi:MFS transporter [Hydrogenibacillus schlegelii]